MDTVAERFPSGLACHELGVAAGDVARVAPQPGGSSPALEHLALLRSRLQVEELPLHVAVDEGFLRLTLAGQEMMGQRLA